MKSQVTDWEEIQQKIYSQNIYNLQIGKKNAENPVEKWATTDLQVNWPFPLPGFAPSLSQTPKSTPGWFLGENHSPSTQQWEASSALSLSP